MGWGTAGNAATTRPTTSLPPAYLFIASCRLTAARHCSAVQAELVRLRGQMDEQVPQLEQVLADTGVWQEAPFVVSSPFVVSTTPASRPLHPSHPPALSNKPTSTAHAAREREALQAGIASATALLFRPGQRAGDGKAGAAAGDGGSAAMELG